MTKHLGLPGRVALSLVVAGLVAGLVGVLLDIDWAEPWQLGPLAVFGIVVAYEVWRWLERRQRPEAAATGPAELPGDVRRIINAHLADGRPINAIKAYRQATGAGLVEAKRAIDSWPAA
ncbi:MAG TPA: hypothetical protein VM575_06900 [Nocardioides sp.]|nr:hypothetical protein [Nocardioides sp.]